MRHRRLSATPQPDHRRRGHRRNIRGRTILVLAAAAALVGGLTTAVPQSANAVTIDTDAYYEIIARHSGKAMDIYQGSTANGAALVQWTRNGGHNQQFRFVPSGDGYYRIMARHSGKVLDVWERSTADGAQVAQYTDLNGANQQFQPIDTDSGYVKLINRNSSKVLDVWERSTADGARISQYTDNNGWNQQWLLVEVDDGGSPGDPNDLQMEDLDRGLISARSGDGNFVSWRLLGTESPGTGFNVYRGSTRVNSAPVTDSTNFWDEGAPAGATYTVRAVVDGTEQAPSKTAIQFSDGYLDVPLQVPAGGSDYSYSANDTSVGDLDGDGRYEFIVKWDPSNSRDNSQSGHTGNVYLDAYRLDGQRLWRIDLGRNIRAGAHYTQFQVYDYDGDGRAEVAMKTADGTVDGTGQVIGDPNADHRNSGGYILSGPEYLTMFDGLTGEALSTVNYLPSRGNVCDWGDCYGNRVDRFLAATAYLDGQRPSLVMARGYYTRAVIVAWDFRNGGLTHRWTFDSDQAGDQWAGQGNHNLSVADVDGDGRQEIVYGAMTVDDNGAGLYTTGFGHGDAMHVGDLIPTRSGLEVFTIHEPGNEPGADVHDAGTGQIIWQSRNNGGSEGPGRGVAADVYAGNAGAEVWGFGNGLTNLYSAYGNPVGRTPSAANFLAWWDADAVRELMDHHHIDKYGTGGDTRLMTGSGVTSINGTKANPALSGDLFGDWREEAAWPTHDSSALRVYTTRDITDRRIFTLMHDAQYRVAIAWQNTAYNQPPHPSFFVGAGMDAPPPPSIYLR